MDQWLKPFPPPPSSHFLGRYYELGGWGRWGWVPPPPRFLGRIIGVAWECKRYQSIVPWIYTLLPFYQGCEEVCERVCERMCECVCVCVCVRVYKRVYARVCERVCDRSSDQGYLNERVDNRGVSTGVCQQGCVNRG